VEHFRAEGIDQVGLIDVDPHPRLKKQADFFINAKNFLSIQEEKIDG
jgi:hypothetical protein